MTPGLEETLVYPRQGDRSHSGWLVIGFEMGDSSRDRKKGLSFH